MKVLKNYLCLISIVFCLGAMSCGNENHPLLENADPELLEQIEGMTIPEIVGFLQDSLGIGNGNPGAPDSTGTSPGITPGEIGSNGGGNGNGNNGNGVGNGGGNGTGNEGNGGGDEEDSTAGTTTGATTGG